jgi:hypothetical protein
MNFHSEIEAAFIWQQTNYDAVGSKPTTMRTVDTPRVFTFEPTPSNVATAFHGAAHRLANGLTKSMEQEFKGSTFETDYNYVVYGKACDTPGESQWAKSSEIKWESRLNFIRDKGHENWTLETFAQLPRVQAAGLTMAEVAMLRIYPTFSRELRSILRREYDFEKWATSISILTSAIIKLSAQAPIQSYYRAIPHAVFDAPDGPLSSGLVHFYDTFSSVTRNVETVVAFAGDPEVPALVFCIDPSWTCRPAALMELSQYPEEEEDLLPPCTMLEITRVFTVGRKKLLQCTPHVSPMRHYTENLRFPWSSPSDPLTSQELQELTRVWSAQSKKQRSMKKSSKYSSTAKDYMVGYGTLRLAALGLDAYMKQGFSDYWVYPNSCEEALAAIEKEFRLHGTDNDREWYDYIMYHAASEQECIPQGTRDKGRGPVTLKDFVHFQEARMAHLSLAHVLALRLYTSPVFSSLNIPLQTYKCDAEGKVLWPPEMQSPHNFPITVIYIQEAILRLRAVEICSGTEGQSLIMWRGNRDLIVSDDCLSRGGVETSITSTTLELETAVQHSFSERPVIFKIMTRSYKERGAFLEWVSVFPDERECCFAPLTFFSPTGRHQVVKVHDRDEQGLVRNSWNVTVIEVTPRLTY